MTADQTSEVSSVQDLDESHLILLRSYPTLDSRANEFQMVSVEELAYFAQQEVLLDQRCRMLTAGERHSEGSTRWIGSWTQAVRLAHRKNCTSVTVVFEIWTSLMLDFESRLLAWG